MAKFIVVGDATVDQMYFMRELPVAGGEVTATRASMEPGGAGGTVATVLARLGNEVSIATRVGTGPFGDLALKNVRLSGVNTELIQIDEQSQTSSVTLLITPDTQRTMISYPGASRRLDAAALRREAITSSDALVMSAYSLVGGMQREYAVQALEIAKESHLTVFIDMGTGAVGALQDRFVSVLLDADYLLMNETELAELTDADNITEGVAWLAKQGIKQVIIKVGELGSMVVTPEFTALVPAYHVEEVTDSTGAGDYYTAAFAHAVMQGCEPKEAALMGNIAGALNVTTIGAQNYPITHELLQELADQQKER